MATTTAEHLRGPHRFPCPATTMRAAVLTAPGRFEMREVGTPQCAPDQALVRLEGCGVCSSSLALWEGRPWFSYPGEAGAPGHEGWGIVEAVGESVTAVACGDRVALLSTHAFADYDAVDEKALVRLPASFAHLAFPGEAFGCGFNVWARAQVSARHTVAVVGVGFLGALLVQLAKAAGARVVAISRRAYSRELAGRLGADLTIDLNDPNAASPIRDFTGGRGCDCVIEATGLQTPLDLAASLVATRGRLVIAGYHQDGPRRVDMQSWNWRGIDVINAHERDPDMYVVGMREAAAAVATGRLDPSPLVSHSFALDQLGEAFAFSRNRPDGFVKAVVRMRPDRPPVALA